MDGRAEVTLTHPVTLPTERILTSGCGGGITFRIDHRLFPRLDSSLRVRPAAAGRADEGPLRAAVHYQRSRGIHGAALADGDRLLIVAEDVGRHNAVDKMKGEALLRGIRPRTASSVHRARLLRDVAEGRPHGGAGRGLAHVAHGDGGGPGRAARASPCAATSGPDGLNVYAGDAIELGTPAVAADG